MKLTDTDKRFLDALFSKEAYFDYEKAKVLAGYPDTTPISQILDKLADPIKERTYKFMTLNAPKGAITLIEALNADRPVSKEQFKAAIEVLDRAGIVKREQVDITHNAPNAVIMLPPKDL